ncbi:Ubiquitin domain-containing protein 1 [Labeo rohita]|uniref:Ubiquitin domain-containing protein 1 n=1 Tax=Labeo rohita TaxID=84645 RepID=A0ABQ8M4R9_LABRO|nr:Ubiquitin domain-containing protein 1 [Labeo rohita]
MGSCLGVIRQRSHLSSRNSSRYSVKRRVCHSDRCFDSRPRRNEPLKKDKPKWKSEYPMTEGQLRSKRDEFWDTAPAFDGRKEIWDALKAAAVAIECNDHELAQAIVDGASITLPHVNLVSEGNDRNVSEHSELQEKKEKEFQLKVRLSTGKDLRLSATMADSIRQLKKQLQTQEDIDAANQRWFFSGKLLTDKTRLLDTKMQKDFVIQVIVSQPIIPN